MAQQSASFRLDQHAINVGGDPRSGSAPASGSFAVSLDSIGEGLSARGLGSASFRMDGGFSSAYPPPGEVVRLRFSDPQTLEWDPEWSAAGYNLYRDRIGNLAGPQINARDREPARRPFPVIGSTL